MRFIRMIKSSLPNENSLGEPISNDPQVLQNFWNWFKGSKVVDEKGRPLVVYHGTINNFDTFNKGNIGENTNNLGIFGNGFYFTNKSDLAKSYIREDGTYAKDGKGNIMSVYLNIKKPFMWENKNIDKAKKLGFPKNRIKENKLLPITNSKEILKFTENLKKDGYDGTIYTYKDGTREYVAFSPNQIKSISNNINYNKEDNNIYGGKQ